MSGPLPRQSDVEWAGRWRWLSLFAIAVALVTLIVGDTTGSIGLWVIAIFGELRAQSRLRGTG